MYKGPLSHPIKEGSVSDATLILEDLKEVVTLAPKGAPKGPRRGRWLGEPGVIEGGAIAVAGGRIVAVGPRDEVRSAYPGAERRGCDGAVALPGFVDPHTHLPFTGSRERDFEARVTGRSYADIALAGGGIRCTMRAVRSASLAELIDAARPRLDRMLEHGTTSAEAKSGYGLELATERRQLEAIAALDREHPIDLVATNLAAHEVPDEYRDDKEAYLELLERQLLPELAPLSRFCDVFCEAHVFSVAQSRRILTRARELGYRLKIHADEIEPIGGTEMACELGAVSVDHLGRVSAEGIARLGGSDTIGVLLPGTTFYLGLEHKAPARRLIEAGAAVALATDLNPGSCLTESMAAILTIAAVDLKMSPAETICAATLNAAHAIGRGADLGSLEVGKRADLVLWDIPTWRYLPTHFGVNLVRDVYKSGRRVVKDQRRVG
jgi:imidazolonepropionase